MRIADGVRGTGRYMDGRLAESKRFGVLASGLPECTSEQARSETKGGSGERGREGKGKKTGRELKKRDGWGIKVGE